MAKGKVSPVTGETLTNKDGLGVLWKCQ